jgi:plastocyanin
MRLRLLAVCAIAAFANIGFAKDVYLSIRGTVSNFSTDLRIFNPSTTKDIQVRAYLLAVGNVDNSSVQPKTITLPKRQSLVYDNALTSLFNTNGVGAIRLKSDDDFVAAQREFTTAGGEPLEQSVLGLDGSAARKQGVLVHIRSTGGMGSVAVVNPNGVTANVTWRFYNKNNELIFTALPVAMAPFAVMTPTSMSTTFFPTAGSADLTGAWVSYTSDQPIFAFASVNNGSTETATSGGRRRACCAAPQAPQPPTPAGKLVAITAHDFAFDVSPQISPTTLAVGDQVTFRISAHNSPHGFILYDPDDNILIQGFIMIPEAAAVDKTITIPKEGTYTYVCFNPDCGTGPGQHTSMVGSFVVGMESEPKPRY